MLQPNHRQRRVLAVLIAGLLAFASACADGDESPEPPGDSQEAIGQPTDSWTRVDFWVQDQPTDAQQFGRQTTLTLGRGDDGSLPFPMIMALVPQDDVARWPDDSGDGLPDNDVGNLIRDLRTASDMCASNQVRRCSYISLSYRPCQLLADCRHHAVTELIGITATDGIVSEVSLYWSDPASKTASAGQVVDLALADYADRGGTTADSVEIKTGLQPGSSRAEEIDRLSRQLGIPAPGLGQSFEVEIPEPEELFAVLDGLLS